MLSKQLMLKTLFKGIYWLVNAFYIPQFKTNATPLHRRNTATERVRLLARLPLCLFSCLFSPGVMQTLFHRQNILCRSCQSVYPQAWVSIWGLTSNIENWPAAPTAFPSKRPLREWERKGRWGATWRRGVVVVVVVGGWVGGWVRGRTNWLGRRGEEEKANRTGG